jgi:hypothetical protein
VTHRLTPDGAIFGAVLSHPLADWALEVRHPRASGCDAQLPVPASVQLGHGGAIPRTAWLTASLPSRTKRGSLARRFRAVTSGTVEPDVGAGTSEWLPLVHQVAERRLPVVPLKCRAITVCVIAYFQAPLTGVALDNRTGGSSFLVPNQVRRVELLWLVVCFAEDTEARSGCPPWRALDQSGGASGPDAAGPCGFVGLWPVASGRDVDRSGRHGCLKSTADVSAGLISATSGVKMPDELIAESQSFDCLRHEFDVESIASVAVGVHCLIS